VNKEIQSKIDKLDDGTRFIALAHAVGIAGSQGALGKQIGVTQQTIYNWLNRSKQGVPGEHCWKIERATGGKITREMLRPDIFGDNDDQ
jgi:DNA-binding transcriptional regulator YdaS (Cro superfamily)